MRIVIDSNVLFSALIRNSLTRKLILEYDGLFLFPEFIFEEMEKHKQELLQKSKMDENDFESLLGLILRKVVIVPNEVLNPYYDDAYGLAKDIDVNDVLFFACALAHPNSVIWSDDKALKKQSKVRVINTKEMAGFI